MNGINPDPTHYPTVWVATSSNEEIHITEQMFADWKTLGSPKWSSFEWLKAIGGAGFRSIQRQVSVEGLSADNERLRAALRLVEWGSCDGCGNKHRCVECGAHREVFNEATDEMIAGTHARGCSIAAALGSPTVEAT